MRQRQKKTIDESDVDDSQEKKRNKVQVNVILGHSSNGEHTPYRRETLRNVSTFRYTGHWLIDYRGLLVESNACHKPQDSQTPTDGMSDKDTKSQVIIGM